MYSFFLIKILANPPVNAITAHSLIRNKSPERAPKVVLGLQNKNKNMISFELDFVQKQLYTLKKARQKNNNMNEEITKLRFLSQFWGWCIILNAQS